MRLTGSGAQRRWRGSVTRYVVDSTLAYEPNSKTKEKFLFGFHCLDCSVRVPAGTYETRRRAIREGSEHVKEMHRIERSDGVRRRSESFAIGFRVGLHDEDKPHRISEHPSFKAGYEEGEAQRLAMENDYTLTEAERKEVDSIGSSNA